jgi:sarcosine oxidase subunit beta
VPAVGGVRVIRTWPAVVNDTADSLPIIGEVRTAPGYFVASFPQMGFTGGPITAHIVANMLLGASQDIDTSKFTPDRFQ